MRNPVFFLSLLLSVCGFAADSVLAPFVQREELAGAVALVANKEKIGRASCRERVFRAV